MPKVKIGQTASTKQGTKAVSVHDVQENIVNDIVETYLQEKVATDKRVNRNQITVDTLSKYEISLLIQEIGHKPESHLTPFEKMNLVRTGISKKGLEQLKSKTTLDYDKFAKMLSTTKATLINKKGEEKFNTALSERILSVADVYSYGYEVFEDADKFNSWMLNPVRALGGKAPYEIMDNQFGREEVRNIIGRIAYGVFS